MGIKEKKQIAELEENINGTLGNALKSALGNSSLNFTTSIDDGIQAEGIRIASYGITEEIFPAFMEVARDDDYRAELAKLQQINFRIRPEIQKPEGFYVYTNLELQGETLNVIIDTSHSPANGNRDALKGYIESLY